MKHVKITVLVPGMVTAEDVIGRNNQLILPKGLVLTERAIKRLESYDILDIRIEDPVNMDVEEIEEVQEIDMSGSDGTVLGSSADSFLSALEEIEKRSQELLNQEVAEKGEFCPSELNPAEKIAIDKSNDLQKSIAEKIKVNTFEESSHFEKLKQSQEFKAFKQSFEDNVEVLQGKINDIVERNAPIQIDDMLSDTMKLLKTQNNTFGVFDMLHNMRQFDDLTYAHSMNVSLICNVFAEWLGLGEEEKKIATACGMLHDIGKLKIDDAIIKKPSKLTDEEYKKIKSHPIEGYKILQKQDISEHIKNSALMHHEKCDGTGYPLKLTGDKIDRYAKMVAIADVYDAMTSARVYRGALCPFTVIKIFEEEGLYKYDTVFIMTFLENVINTYIDNRVLLSNGKVGIIKWIDKQKLSRPMLMMPDESFLELSKHLELNIIKIL